MVSVSVRHDLYRFADTLDDLQRTQLPFATALAITATARAVQRGITAEIPTIFAHKGPPTPFTRRAIGMTAARKSNLRAQVFVKRAQAAYLGIEEEGGTVTRASGAPILTPVNAPLNAYANIPRGTMRKLLGSPQHYFLGTIRGVYGIWERVGGAAAGKPGAHHVRLIAAMRERARYQPRFGFHRRAAATVAATFVPALSAGLARAMATAIHHR